MKNAYWKAREVSDRGKEKLREMPRASSLSGYVWKTIFFLARNQIKKREPRHRHRKKREREREERAKRSAFQVA